MTGPDRETSRRSLTAGILGLLTSRVIGLALGLVVSLSLTRGLGPTEFGWFSIALVGAGLGTMLTDFGTTNVATRDLSDPKADRALVASALLGAQGVIAIATMSIALAASAAIPGIDRRLLFVEVVASSVLTIPTVLRAVLAAHLRPAYISTVTLVQNGIWTLAAVIAARSGGSPILYAHGFALSNVIAALLTWWFARRLQRLGSPAWVRASRQLLRDAAPFGVAAVCFYAFQRAPIFILQITDGPRATALLGASYRLLDAASLVPLTLGATLVPLIVRYRSAGKAHDRVVLYVLRVLVAACMAIVPALPACGALGALLFGDDYRGIGAPLALVLLSLVAFSLDVVWVGLLTVLGNTRAIATSAIWALIVATLGGLALVPPLGATGAAAATLIGQTTRSGLLGAAARRGGSGLPIAAWAVTVGIASASTALSLGVGQWNAWAGAASGVGLYVALLLGLRVITAADVRLLVSRDAV